MTARGYAARAVRVIVEVMWLRVVVGIKDKVGKWTALYTITPSPKRVGRAPDNPASRVFYDNNYSLCPLVSFLSCFFYGYSLIYKDPVYKPRQRR
jgi:hypothetical protein